MTSPTELGQLKFASNISLRERTPHFHSVKRNIFRVWRSFVGFCFLKSCHEFIGSGFWQLRLSPISSQKVCLSGWSSLVHQLIPSTFFDFFLFLIIFLHMFLEAPRLLERLLCSMCTIILWAGILPLTCLFTTTAAACWMTW